MAGEQKYTKPKLRERLKEEIKNSDKGGRKGQWSARKAQLLAQEYEKRGGGYKGEKSESQKHLETWGEEDWQTKEGGSRARKGKETKRYLPKKAWERLSEKEKRATDRKKRRESREGKQHVANTPKAKEAGRKARGHRGKKDLESRTKGELYERAKRLDIGGRSTMSKSELAEAIRKKS